MKFMMIVKASKESEAGVMPSEALLNSMAKYNEELMKAGVLLDLSGLQSSSKGARIKYSNGKRVAVVDGPFAETKELIAGYWIIQVKSREEALEWAKRAPAPFGELAVQPYRGKPAVVVASQGLAYDDGPQQGLDHGVPVLREILGRALGMDVTVLYTRYTLAGRVPQLEQMIGRAAAEHEAALRQAAELATTLP